MLRMLKSQPLDGLDWMVHDRLAMISGTSYNNFLCMPACFINRPAQTIDTGIVRNGNPTSIEFANASVSSNPREQSYWVVLRHFEHYT